MADRPRYPAPPVPGPSHVPTPAMPTGPHPTPQMGQMPGQMTGQMPPMPPVPPSPPSAPASQRSPQLTYPSPGVPMYPQSGPSLVTAPTAVPLQFPQPGTTLTSPKGSYVVRQVLGSGEFGAVYETVGPFDQVYAVKMVRPANRPYQEVYAEWAREVQRLMSLRHPNVVYIFDAFEENHLFYLALERCDHALTAMLGTPMQEGLVIELARQLLAAIQFLHDNDVVHDDLHPGNVLITHHDRPIVKISDFGISHELRGMGAIRPNVVHHAIMAPEILASGYTTKQSDLYQLGLLLYWMLTGQPAIDAGLSYQELVRFVADGEPRKRAEALKTPLGERIAKMLRRRETFRYSSPRDVWADLRGLPAWQHRQLFPVK